MSHGLTPDAARNIDLREHEMNNRKEMEVCLKLSEWLARRLLFPFNQWFVRPSVGRTDPRISSTVPTEDGRTSGFSGNPRSKQVSPADTADPRIR